MIDEFKEAGFNWSNWFHTRPWLQSNSIFYAKSDIDAVIRIKLRLSSYGRIQQNKSDLIDAQKYKTNYAKYTIRRDYTMRIKMRIL